jgi:hypothetical protein
MSHSITHHGAIFGVMAIEILLPIISYMMSYARVKMRYAQKPDYQVKMAQGIIVTGISFWLQVWVIEKKGPLFTSMFTPLALIITAIFSAFLWKETLHWGRSNPFTFSGQYYF